MLVSQVDFIASWKALLIALHMSLWTLDSGAMEGVCAQKGAVTDTAHAKAGECEERCTHIALCYRRFKFSQEVQSLCLHPRRTQSVSLKPEGLQPLAVSDGAVPLVDCAVRLYSNRTSCTARKTAGDICNMHLRGRHLHHHFSSVRWLHLH